MPRSEMAPVVLFVDDEAPNLSTFVRVFRRDFRVRTAGSGEEALRALEIQPVDVVITDYTMPGISGLELLEIVARRWPHVARVLISGHAELDELNDEGDGLARAVLPKPWSREMVLSTVARVVGDTRPVEDAVNRATSEPAA
jgi:DNA-binding NtrC family response regulator